MKRIHRIMIAAALITALSGCSQLTEDNSLMTELTDNELYGTEQQTVTEEVSETSVTTVTEPVTYTTAETIPPIIQALPVSEPYETTAAEMTETVSQVTEEISAAPQITVVTLPTSQPQTATSVTTAVQTEAYVPQTTAQQIIQPPSYSSTSYYALNFSRQKAMWISYLEYDRIMRDHDEAYFTQALAECFDNISSLGCNTVYFQVRAYGDAYYSSSLFPKADRLTGDYDPLKIAVKLAHDRGISIHAWVNPMRLMTDSRMGNVPSGYAIGDWYRDPSKNGTYMVSSGGRYYLNPAYSETVKLICEGINEILVNYDVDGIQIDDYFYPTTDKSFDSAAYSASGTELSLADWRRENVTRMVKLMYRTVHSANPTAVFGISPQGNMNNNYNDLYADIYTWTSKEGCCDYICPQIYFGFDNGAVPYTQTVDAWSKLIKRNGISLVIGLAAYKSGTEDSYAGSGKKEWIDNTDVLSRQMDVTDIYGAGYAYFRYDSLFKPEQSVSAYVNAELENIKK